MSSKDIVTIQSIASDIEQTVAEILHGPQGWSGDAFFQQQVSADDVGNDGESEYTLEDLSSLVAGALTCSPPRTSPRSTLEFGISPPFNSHEEVNSRTTLSTIDENGRCRDSEGSFSSQEGSKSSRGQHDPARKAHQVNQRPDQLKGTAENGSQLLQSGRPAVNGAVKDHAATELGSSFVGDLQISFFKGRDGSGEDDDTQEFFVLEVQPLLNSHNMKAVRSKKGMKRSLSASWKPPRPPRKEPLGHSHSFSHKSCHVVEQPTLQPTSPSAPLLWELAGPKPVPASDCLTDYWAHICLLLILLSLTFLLLSLACKCNTLMRFGSIQGTSYCSDG